MSKEVKCFDCKAVVEDDSLKPEEERTPCPQCGGLVRLISVGDSLAAYWKVEANDRGQSRESAEVHVTGEGNVSVKGSKTEPVTFVEFPGLAQSQFELRIGSVGSLRALEVSEGGKVLASGLGDDLVEALLSMLPYMLPPDHPEYPKPPRES